MFVYFGGGSAAACRGSDGPASRVAMAALQNPEGPLPPLDAKPLNLTCSGAVTVINPEQSLYYMSAPENNYRKVCKNLSSPLSLAVLCLTTLPPPFPAAQTILLSS